MIQFIKLATASRAAATCCRRRSGWLAAVGVHVLHCDRGLGFACKGFEERAGAAEWSATVELDSALGFVLPMQARALPLRTQA